MQAGAADSSEMSSAEAFVVAPEELVVQDDRRIETDA